MIDYLKQREREQKRQDNTIITTIYPSVSQFDDSAFNQPIKFYECHFISIGAVRRWKTIRFSPQISAISFRMILLNKDFIFNEISLMS